MRQIKEEVESTGELTNKWLYKRRDELLHEVQAENPEMPRKRSRWSAKTFAKSETNDTQNKKGSEEIEIASGAAQSSKGNAWLLQETQPPSL